MRYDLIVVGGGPGGLVAAKTAAEDGMKVLLIERKKNITEINRTCAQIFYIRKLSFGGLHTDGYIEPVSVEIDEANYRFHFPVPGFSLDYNGPFKPYLHWVELSPSKYLIYRRRNTFWGFFYDKEAFLTRLLASAQKVGAEILPETIGIGAENTPDGVKVRVRGKQGEQTFEARAAIAADGIGSNIVESLGLNKKRRVLTSTKMIAYEQEEVETDFPQSSFASIFIPSVNRFMTIFLGLLDGDKTQLTSGSEETIQKFMKHPNFAPWFRHAHLVRKTAFSYTVRTPIKEPVEGNVVVVGDAAAPIETWIQGAVACGYQAVKAIEKEINGQKGYQEYIDWWQKAFYFNKPVYWEYVFYTFALANAWTCDEDVDYVFNLLQDKEGHVHTMINENMELIKAGRPAFYERLKKGYEEAAKSDISKIAS